MKVSRISTLACGLVLLATPISAAGMASQQHILVSKHIKGRQFSPAIALNPDTGNVLAAWLAIDPKDNDKRTVWTSLLKRKKSGKYGRKKPVRLAPGNKGKKAIDNGSPRVVWAPGMKAFYVVWQAFLPDGTSEIRARVVKRKTGKPKGGIKVLARGGAYNTSPQVDAILVDGHHEGEVVYVHKPTGADFDELEQSVQEFAKNGKPRGEPVVLATGTSSETSTAGAYLIDSAAGPAAAGPTIGRLLYLEVRYLDSDKCEYVLWDRAQDAVLDTYEVTGGCSAGERIRLSNTEFRVIEKHHEDGRVVERLIGVNTDTLKIEQLRSDTWDPADVVYELRCSIIWVNLVNDSLERRRGDAPNLDPDGDLFAITWDDSQAYLLRVTKDGSVSSSVAFGYKNGLGSVLGTGTGKSDPARAVVVYLEGAYGDEQLMADVLDLSS